MKQTSQLSILCPDVLEVNPEKVLREWVDRNGFPASSFWKILLWSPGDGACRHAEQELLAFSLMNHERSFSRKVIWWTVRLARILHSPFNCEGDRNQKHCSKHITLEKLTVNCAQSCLWCEQVSCNAELSQSPLLERIWGTASRKAALLQTSLKGGWHLSSPSIIFLSDSMWAVTERGIGRQKMCLKGTEKAVRQSLVNQFANQRGFQTAMWPSAMQRLLHQEREGT